VVGDVTLVQSEGELVNIAVKVLFASVMIDADQAALQDGPYALDSIRMSRATRVLANGVVDRLVTEEQPAKVVVGCVLVRVKLAPDFHRSMNLVLNRVDGIVWHNLGVDASATFPHPEHSNLADRTASGFQLFVLVLVTFESANEALIYLNRPAEFFTVAIRPEIAASLTEPAEYEPCGLLSDADLFSQLHRRDSLACRHEQIHGVEPLVQGDLGALHYSPGAHGEVKGAGQASIVSVLPRGACCQGAHALTAEAHGAYRAGWPHPAFKVEPRGFFVGEKREELERADGGARHFNELPLRSALP